MRLAAPTASGRRNPKKEDGPVTYDHQLMVRILRYLKPSIGLVVLAAVLLVLFSLISLAGPLITRIGIDDYINKCDFGRLIDLSLF